MKNNECGFDSYLEDEESSESLQRIASLSYKSLEINSTIYDRIYKGFGTYIQDGETDSSWVPEGFGYLYGRLGAFDTRNICKEALLQGEWSYQGSHHIVRGQYLTQNKSTYGFFMVKLEKFQVLQCMKE